MVFCAALAALPGGAALGAYRVIDLGPIIEMTGRKGAGVNAVNDAGQVALSNANTGAYRGYRYENGNSTNLGTLGGAESFASGINQAGQIAGRSLTPGGVRHAFVWTAGGTNGIASNPQMRDLAPSGGQAEAYAINNVGQVVGYATQGSGGNAADKPFRYSGTTMTFLPLPAGRDHGYAYGINDAGVVVGQAYNKQFSSTRAFLYNGTATIDIGDLGGGQASALENNNSNKVVGYAVNGDGFDRAFLYEDATMFDLGTLGGNYSYANSINNGNQIVGGAFTDAADSIFHAFLYEQGVMTDLNSLLDASGANWVLNEATAISNNGLIVGAGTYSGAKHMFLLKAVPPPILGDANGDGVVGFADFQIVERNFGTAGDFSMGDFSGDGWVDHLDFNILHEHFGDVRTEAGIVEGAAVPEPAGAAMISLAGAAALARRRINRR